ncbi:SDR family oxidoreductase [Neorhizobium sp. S3-V5DH]|jgi:uncharacterized protein YbjT (DUF2867 family)|uniref:NAD(P)-dependent oxidoreductase n=1 Tax=Neorhizobium sp. S3-V5DH TaxID=2485166 RepID=UPI001049082C|nr:SDR family oxidoreductase [Neorhizobium sp. S3-V5DH]TCV60248.1 putative NADH-flavin reductase [Neorhizobium sp. S3-V5DH]
MSTSENQLSPLPEIVILGATGPTGRHIVAQAVSRGYDVTVLVRSPEKAKYLKGANLVVGDARDENALRKALRGRDAVISALGTPASPFRDVTLLSTATRALVKAMEDEHIARLVAITGVGAGDSRGHGGALFNHIIFPILLRKVYADKNRQEDVIRASGLDWTIVRSTILSNKSGTGAVRAMTDLKGFRGGSIAREDVARFVLDQLTSDEWRQKSPLITA